MIIYRVPYDTEGATEEVPRQKPAELLEFALQQLCQFCWDLNVYLASPASGRPGGTLAPSLNQPRAQWLSSECRRTLVVPSAARAAH